MGGEGLQAPVLGGSLSFREWQPWGTWRVPKRLGKPSLGSVDPPRAKGGGEEGVASVSASDSVPLSAWRALGPFCTPFTPTLPGTLNPKGWVRPGAE